MITSNKKLAWQAVLVAGLGLTAPATVAASLSQAIRAVQPKMVKIYAAGGLRGLESYQSGFMISGEGHVLTAWSYVLDTDAVIVTLHDGARHEAQLVAADPRLEIALLKIETQGADFFELSSAVKLQGGDRILAFSNLYGIATGDEPTSVLHGSVAATTKLSARRGIFKTPYDGDVYILDAVTNNSGAAGGALTDHRGRLAGILGKELRSAETNRWLNYAVPVHELRDSVRDMLEGRAPTPLATADRATAEAPWTVTAIGLRLVPNVMPLTPPYVERVIPGSPAYKAGLRADDLVMYVDRTLVRSLNELQQQLELHDSADTLVMAVLRDNKIINIEIAPLDE